MIPLHLSLSGFLSYRDRAELDFTGFELACIAGANGAGKSSLLDAITWALFGQARKRDDSLINAQSSAAEVSLTFAYEGNIYRVQRTLPQGKTTQLELQIFQQDQAGGNSSETGKQTLRWPVPGQWKPLTGSTLRETQERIESTLRMSYETFANASFFLQGKADQFTQQRPGDRKRILGSILGLEIWESYQRAAADRRKAIEAEITSLDGRLEEINTELGEEATRKARLKELRLELERLSGSRAAQEAVLEQVRKTAAQLEEQRKLVEALAKQLDVYNQQIADSQRRLAERRQEQAQYQDILTHAAEIEAAYQAWLQARHDVEYWDEIAIRFRDGEKRRQAPLDEINTARARLEQERKGLLEQEGSLNALLLETESIQLKMDASQAAMQTAAEERQLAETLKAERETAVQKQAEARAENPRLKAQMDELKERIHKIADIEGALCPLCGQPLSPTDRQRLIQELETQGREMGDRYRANQTLLREAEQLTHSLTTQITALSRADAELLQHSQQVTHLTTRLEQITLSQSGWQRESAPRLAEVTSSLEQEAFATSARLSLAEIDAELKAIGYDAAAHDRARRAEAQGRTADAALRSLEKARAALAPLDREINEMETQLARLQAEAASHQETTEHARQALDAALAEAPDRNAIERELIALKEMENRLRLEVGAAQQKVDVLGDLKRRRKSWEAQREERARLVGQLRQLERAFGKDGVPALLIEQALPEIEAKANEILDRLSSGNMSVRFITQAAYKDRRREDLRETLDIQISDGAGTRDYEMFSGGEAFRVNFAIRLALSEVLAQRAGARLQTLVIDEGFGSQDALGRQRLVEAINLVRPDFAKILVITHIEELKDAFPNRIEVEKTERGSTILVT
jgi:DNA repair protein SbcC/Rad50